MICEAKRIWGHLLLLRLWERLPNQCRPSARGPGRFNRLMRLCRFAEQSTLPHSITCHSVYLCLSASGGLAGSWRFSAAC